MAAVGAQQEAARKEVSESVNVALAAAREQVCRSALRWAPCVSVRPSDFATTHPCPPCGQKKRKADASEASGSKAVKSITSKWFAEMEEIEDDSDDEDGS
jgi:hypothetical protein